VIELTINDLLILGVAAAILVIALVRIFSNLRRKATQMRQRRSIFYCNVCVHYFHDEGDERHVNCPICDRPAKRGRNRRLA